MFKTLLLLLLIPSGVLAQEGKVDATWLHRSISPPNKNDVQAGTCQYKPIFGEGDPDNRILRTVTRFGEFTVAANSKCQAALYDRQEEIYFVVEGNAVLHYADQTYPMRTNDFTYLPPAVSHSIANASGQMLRVLVMSFKIPARISIGAAPPAPKIVNLDAVKKQTVEGHPTSVQYKLLLGPRTATRDAIDQAYVVSSFFWMDFVPGGTNFPHHHEAAEEIYLVMAGRGEIVAGGGTDGIEGRHPAAAGDAYYFRPNCTVGFYNQNKPGATAKILAVRARIPPPDEDD
ncbi:MAG TPA: cupin domain-containing protein [Terriglobales bacterium]|nr:cupin domain-containing protein [Terriglobales bacterium]